MTTARVKKMAAEVIGSREELEKMVGRIRLLVIGRDALMGEKNEALKHLDDEFGPRLSGMADAIEARLEVVEAWAGEHVEEFGSKKSMELTHGTIGWRTGQPKLKTRKGITWARVLENLGMLRLLDYIREKMEPDKERLIADRVTLGDETLKTIGVEVVQEETFYVEPRIEVAAEVAP